LLKRCDQLVETIPTVETIEILGATYARRSMLEKGGNFFG
jgi:hypothetical protein